MNPFPMGTGVKVWLSTGYTDMRCGFPSLALRVQEVALAMEVAQRGGYCGGRVNSSRNNACERSKPSSVRINDFDLLTGSPIKPFL